MANSVDNTALRVLVAEDEDTLRESCASVLVHEGYDVVSCGRGDEARQLVQRREFDVVLLDLNLSQVPGMEVLRVCQQVNPESLVIVMTATPGVDSSIQAIQAGAWEYLPKPFTATHLRILLGRAGHILASSRREQMREPHPSEQYGHSPRVTLLGRSAPFLRMIRLAEKVARTDASVFLTGESGSGKEVIAQYIHHHSRRSEKPIVAVNCAALPETLLESEMFGHCKGAFTGAIRDKPGLLESASGGTFFLDELTEMSQPIQAKLLRVIQDGIVRRVGSEIVDATVDVRFIAATNRDAAEATKDGHLRKDLYYRLSVVPIHVPPLRERREDVPILAEYFLTLYWRRHREKGAPTPKLSETAIRSLQARHWSGNVRELQNVMEHAVVLLEPGSEVQPDDLPYLDGSSSERSFRSRGGDWAILPDAAEMEYHDAREQVLSAFELNYLSSILGRAGANMSKAAKMAGVDRTTLYRLMEKHGLQRDTLIKPS